MGRHSKPSSLAIITSRWESKRLPGKALKKIGDDEILLHVCNRVFQSGVDELVVATTPSSQPIIDFCALNEIPFFVGDEEDILDRLFNAAKSFKADVIVRVWADQPFIDPEIVGKALRLFNTCKTQYVYTKDYPKGMQCAVVGFEDLNMVHKTLKSKKDRHWIHLWMKDNLKAIPCSAPLDWTRYDFGVDDEKDLEVMNWLYHKTKDYSVEGLIRAITS